MPRYLITRPGEKPAAEKNPSYNKQQKRMKRIITLWAAALVVLAPSFARGDNEDIRAARHEARQAQKEAAAAGKVLRKDGFRCYDPGTPSYPLERYFLKVNAGCTGIIGTSGPCVTENLAKVTALANAANEYAMLQGGRVRGRIVSTASALSGQQADNIVTSFERLVEKTIRGELLPCAVYYRERGGRYQVRAYCVVDEDAAARARRHAMELALEEAGLTERYGSLVSGWIGEGFDEVSGGL